MNNIEHQIEAISRKIELINSDPESRKVNWRLVFHLEAEKKALEKSLVSFLAEAEWHDREEKRKRIASADYAARADLTQQQIEIQNKKTREYEQANKAAKEAAIDKACREIGLIP